ncbi:putative nuclease HARBI1 [Carcharodon carcharias]|uniref:putative nuclease HARBI1 n=1 Tax=Carcharodon carcharias TaxID=13397 RepID=UPI001B7EB450|nr:putative nuclease HARBI1 [Carcharodon carcharias]
MVTEICAHIANDLTPHSTGRHALPVAINITVALNLLAPGSLQGSAADLKGISRASHNVAYHCISQFTDALFARTGWYIHFMTDAASEGQGALGFTTITGSLQGQGIISCTHVAIKAPSNQPVRPINRKGFHTLNVESQKGFLHMCTCFPDSCQHSFILRKSRLPQIFIPTQSTRNDPRGQALSPEDNASHPLKEPQTEVWKLYSQCYSLSRTAVEQSIGLLIMWFQYLDRSGSALQYPLARVSIDMVVYSALHYMALQRDVGLEDKEKPYLGRSRR